MKLTRQQQNPPPHHAHPQPLSQASRENQQRGGIGEPQECADDELGVAEADEVDDGPAEAGEEDGADKRPRYGAGKLKMVVSGA